jgi:hypothetical protein
MTDRFERSAGIHHASCATGWRAAAMVALLAVGSAACGSASKPTQGATTTTAPVRFAPDAVIAQVAVVGGFVGRRDAVRQIPSVTVLGDGSVVKPGAVAAIYPGPAIVPLLRGHISPAQIVRLLADAHRLGLLAGPLDFGRPPISDLPTTSVRIDDGRRSVVQSAYWLGGDTPDAGLTAPQRAARRALQSFVDELQSFHGDEQPFVPPAVAVFTLTGTIPPPAQPPRRWPIATRPAPAGTPDVACVVVKGAEVATLLDALAEANENTPWKIGADTLSLAFKPLVTGDEGCAP